MKKLIQVVAALSSVCLLSNCERHARASKSLGGPVEIIPSSARVYIPARTETAALNAVAGALRHAPTGKLYVLDSTRIRDAGDKWQVLVLRNDSAGHRLAYSHFDVEKVTGNVQCLGSLR